MFNMIGNKVYICRYKICFKDSDKLDYLPNNGYIFLINKDELDYMVDIYDKQNRNYVVEEIDISDNIWIDGLEFDSYDLAKAAFDMGEKSYKKYIYEQNKKELQRNRAIKVILNQLTLSESEIMMFADLYDTWEPNQSYFKDAIISYGVNKDKETQLYYITIDHISQVDETPDISDKYKPIGMNGKTKIWTEPYTEGDAYMKDDKVEYNGKKWYSNIDFNMSPPNSETWRNKK